MSILVIDVGTSGLRAAIVMPDATVRHVHRRPFPPSAPFPGLVEFDAAAMAALVLEVADAALADHGTPVDAVGITNQRASTIAWHQGTGHPIGPAIGWQDLRTVMDCITAKAQHGLALAPNQTATKVKWLIDNSPAFTGGDVVFGTVDTWVAWVLSRGSLHVTDRSNAAVTGLFAPDLSGWSPAACAAMGVDPAALPRIVDTSGVIGEAGALPGAPPIAALVGDQQASLVGQSCVRPGATKVTFGTGGMLDTCSGTNPPASAHRSEHGTFPIVVWGRGDEVMWGVEAIMLSAGSNVDWLCDDIGLIASPADSHDVAAQCDTTGGVVYVPALLGLGTPHWDFGARGALFGITRGTGRAHVVRAVLQGVAQRGADLLEAAEADLDLSISTVRVDGGMTDNPTFVQAFADAVARPVEISPVREATTLGAGFLAGLAVGTWSSFDDIESAWSPRHIVEPGASSDREKWRDAVGRARSWIPALSALDF